MTKRVLFWYSRQVVLGLVLLLTLSACAGISFGGGGTTAGTKTPTPTTAGAISATQPVAVPSQQPTVPAIPSVTGINPNQLLNINLITNGNAESGPGATTEETIEPIPGWTRHGPVDVMVYTANDSTGFIAVGDPGPTDRGKNYFWGGGDDIDGLGSSAITSITQTIDLSQASTVLSQGQIQYTLSAWLGGYLGQDDNAKLSIQFVSATGQTLGTASVGPVLAAARNNANGLLQRTTSGAVPTGTATINVTLTMTLTGGADNDGSADDLSLMFHL